MARVTKNVLKWLVSFGIGALFAWLTLRDWPLPRLFENVRLSGLYIVAGTWEVHLGWLLIYFLTLVVMHAFRVWRWKPLLQPLVSVDVWTLNRVSSIGFLAMFLLPFRLGELVRPALLSTEVQVRRSEALATIVLERTTDGVLVASFLAIALVFMPKEETTAYRELQVATVLALALFCGLIALLIAVFIFRMEVTAFLGRLAKSVGGSTLSRVASSISARFLKGLSVFPDWRRFLLFLFGSLGYWGSNCAGLFILARGFGLEIPFTAAVAMMATIVVGMMIPNPPGNIGTFWFFLLKPLELYGLSRRPVALAFAFTVYGLQLAQLVLFASWYLARYKISLRRAFSVSFRELAEANGPLPPT